MNLMFKIWTVSGYLNIVITKRNLLNWDCELCCFESSGSLKRMNDIGS